MKCGYVTCKLGGEVLKEEGVKSGSRWFHKECLKEKELKTEIETYWLSQINRGTVLQILRKAIKDLVAIYDAEYVLWVIKSCKSKNIRLSHPMGLKSLCSDNRFFDEWNKGKINKKIREINGEFNKFINTEQSEIKYINRSKNFIKIL